ncbi:MAG: hypothetical protein LE178_04635 [Endomicrobium sp.]|nr:hypothetical protein [Endomicrobium sp.]
MTKEDIQNIISKNKKVSRDTLDKMQEQFLQIKIDIPEKIQDSPEKTFNDLETQNKYVSPKWLTN